MKSLESTLLAEQLDLINVLVAAIIPGTGITLGVLVGQDGAQGIQNGTGGEVFGSNEDERGALAGLLLFDQVAQLRIGGGQPFVEGLPCRGAGGYG